MELKSALIFRKQMCMTRDFPVDSTIDMVQTKASTDQDVVRGHKYETE